MHPDLVYKIVLYSGEKNEYTDNRESERYESRLRHECSFSILNWRRDI